MGDEVWIAVKDGALHAGVSVQTVYTWIRRGHLAVPGLDHGLKVFRHLDVARAEMVPRTKAKRSLAKAG